jgi:hypothetical protein
VVRNARVTAANADIGVAGAAFLWSFGADLTQTRDQSPWRRGSDEREAGSP